MTLDVARNMITLAAHPRARARRSSFTWSSLYRLFH